MLTLALALLSSTMPANGSYRAHVDGNDYKVKIKGEQVKVVNMSSITAIRMGRSVKRRKEMIAAVKIATGCELSDPYWKDNLLMGALDCSAPAE